MNRKNQVHSAEGVAPKKRLECEKLLADLSARFVALPPERVNDEIRDSLPWYGYPFGYWSKEFEEEAGLL